MKFKPYLAIDTETTSLDPKTGKILQLAAVYDDGVSPIGKLQTFNCFLNWEGEYVKLENYALYMNSWIIEGIAKSTLDNVGRPFNVRNEFLEFLKFIKPNPTYKLTVAGKNLAGFDIPFIETNLDHFGFEKLTSHFSHKVIDVGSLYLPDFGYMPSLDEVNKLIGRQKVSHNALDDCYDVVYAIRHKLQIGV